MSEIFISYSRRDTETVDQFVERLERAEMAVWIDREDIKAGDSWRVQIVEAIDICKAFVFMLSKNSAKSVNVQKEIILARDSGRPIFIVQLEPAAIPAEIKYQLAGLQMVDMPMLGFDKAVDNLTSALRDHLQKAAASAQPQQKQAELVIQGVDIASFTADKQQQLLAFLASLTSTDQSQIKIASLAPGSVHAFVDLPAHAAYQLKTFALNHDPRLAKMNIVALRLSGSANFIQTASGILTGAAKPPRAKINPLAIIAGVAIIAALGFFLTRASPPVPEILPTFTATWTLTETPSATATSTPAATPVPTDTLIPTDTPTSIPSDTPSPTPVAVFDVLDGVVTESRLNCRYGPGADYLYKYGLKQGLELKVLGRDETGTWVYVQGLWYDQPCWLNLKLISMRGDVSQLEVLYPGKYQLPPSRWPLLQNVTAKWLGENKLEISWTEFLLPLGERESAESPLYLAELWLCKDGQITFTPMGVWEPYLEVIDETGCAEPSHGRMYLAEKHGYAGPVEIIWPPR